MKDLLFVTTNKGKVEEAHAILGVPVEIENAELDEVQSMDVEYVAKKKAEEAFKKYKKPLIVDDVAVFVEAFNGFPGPFAKHLITTIGIDGFIKLMNDEENRNVTLRCAIGFHDGENIRVFIGEVNGKLTRERRGEKGWGFDPVVVPDGYNQTFAEMGPDKKNDVSHRRLALDKFKQYLDSQEK